MPNRHRSTSIRQPTAIMITGRPTAVIGVIHGFRSVLVSVEGITVVTIMAIIAAVITPVDTIRVAAILAEATTGATVEATAVLATTVEVCRLVPPVAVTKLVIRAVAVRLVPPA